MLDRMQVGEVPRKHHIVFKDAEGNLLSEECVTREGFDGPYTIAYHQHRPHTQTPMKTTHGFPIAEAAPGPLAKRHFDTNRIMRRGGEPLDSRVPVLFNKDVTISVMFPAQSDTAYFANGDGDDLYYIHEGGGLLRTPYGDVRFEKDDYLFVPRGTIHRIALDTTKSHHWLAMEMHGGLHLPKQFRNAMGQLRMDAPFSHRDFKRPMFRGPLDEDIRELVVKRRNQFMGYKLENSPLDVVGWDGTVYPWAFPILNFQPRAGQVHLPPTLHGTFAARGLLVCSFVPRVVDFHPEAIPCPYPHSSVDVDEFIFYCRGNFTSRRGIGPGSVSFHPAGIPHGPHPGAYEKSIGTQRTDELAVMLDCFDPLSPTPFATAVDDANYMQSFVE